MKPTSWRFTWELATVGWSGGRPSAHAFVDGSSAPICRAAVPGTPPVGLSVGHVDQCVECRKREVTAWWSCEPFRDRFVWRAQTSDYRNFSFETVSGHVKQSARGLASDEADALRQALAAIDRLVPGDVPVEISRGGSSELREYIRELRADERASKVSDGSGAQLTEYVYLHSKRYTSFYSTDFEWETTRYRVTKKTAKRYFVEASVKTTDAGNVLLRNWSLDRAELEAGKTLRHGWTLSPEAPASPFARVKPGWAEVLGVEVTCSVRDIKTAFRAKAKESHPDHGGSAEAFQRVKAAFDAAMQARGAA